MKKNRIAVIFTVFLSFMLAACQNSEGEKPKEDVPAASSVAAESQEPIEESESETETVRYEDALIRLFSQFDVNNEESAQLLEEYGAKINENGEQIPYNIKDGWTHTGYCFVNTDEDLALEVLIFYDDVYAQDVSKTTFALFDYNKKDGFVHLYTQSYALGPSFESTPIDIASGIDLIGYRDNNTQKLSYVLVTNTEATELSTMTYYLNADEITNHGLKNIAERNVHSYCHDLDTFGFMGNKTSQIGYITGIYDYFDNKTEFYVEMNYFSENDILDPVEMQENVSKAYRRAQSITNTNITDNEYANDRWYLDEEGFLSYISTIKRSFSGNTNSNLMNGGLVAGDSMWTFFCSDKGIYRMKNGYYLDSKVEIITADRPRCLNISGDWLYFLSNSTIYRSKFDGSEITQISPDGVYGNQFQIQGDVIYFYGADAGLRKMSLDGNDFQFVFQEDGIPAFDVNVAPDGIYYFLSNNENLSNNSKTFSSTGTYYWYRESDANFGNNPISVRCLLYQPDNSLYYISEKVSYEKDELLRVINRLDLDSGETETIAEAPESAYLKMNITNDTLFYSYDGIYIANLDGSEAKKISHINANFIYCNPYDDDYFYIVNDNKLYRMTKSHPEAAYICDSYTSG